MRILLLLWLIQLPGLTYSAQVLPEQADITVAIVVDNPLNDIGIMLIRELYAQAGLTTQFVNLSAARSERLQHDGDIDAELVRVEGLDKIPVDMLKVPEPILEVVISAYTINPELTDAKPTTLINQRLGARHGLDISKRYPGMQLTEVYRLKQLAYMLKHKRLDAIILSKTTSYFMIHKYGIKELRQLTPPLARFNVYHYVHKKHKSLLPTLTQALQSVKKKGRPQQLLQVYMKNLIEHSKQEK